MFFTERIARTYPSRKITRDVNNTSEVRAALLIRYYCEAIDNNYLLRGILSSAMLIVKRDVLLNIE